MSIIFLALLFANVRGNWLAAKWDTESGDATPPMRLNETIGDKLVDQLPTVVWPKARFVFYVVAALQIALLTFLLVR